MNAVKASLNIIGRGVIGVGCATGGAESGVSDDIDAAVSPSDIDSGVFRFLGFRGFGFAT